MATIKLQNGKVITKSGKVSCTCCGGGGCCMYPAQALVDGLYRWEDLPDELEYYFSTGALRFTLQKVAPRPIGANPEILYYEDIGGNDEAFIGLTEFGDQTPNQWEWAGGPATTNVDPYCLLVDGTQAEPMDFKNYLLRDKFADTYTVQIIRPDDDAGTFIVTRRSLCEWSSEIDEFGNPAGCKLRYVGELILPGIGYNWYISKSSYLWFKDGFANTPVGDYGKDTAEYAIVS